MNLIINGREECGVTSLEAAGGMRWEHQSSKENEHLSSEKNTGLNLPWTGPGSFRKGRAGQELQPCRIYVHCCISHRLLAANDGFTAGTRFSEPIAGSRKLLRWFIWVQDLLKAWLNLHSGTSRLTYFHPTFPPSLGVRPALFTGSSSFFQLPSSFSTVS